jgi:hypothetical protein
MPEADGRPPAARLGRRGRSGPEPPGDALLDSSFHSESRGTLRRGLWPVVGSYSWPCPFGASDFSACRGKPPRLAPNPRGYLSGLPWSLRLQGLPPRNFRELWHNRFFPLDGSRPYGPDRRASPAPTARRATNTITEFSVGLLTKSRLLALLGALVSVRRGLRPGVHPRIGLTLRVRPRARHARRFASLDLGPRGLGHDARREELQATR